MSVNTQVGILKKTAKHNLQYCRNDGDCNTSSLQCEVKTPIFNEVIQARDEHIAECCREHADKTGRVSVSRRRHFIDWKQINVVQKLLTAERGFEFM